MGQDEPVARRKFILLSGVHGRPPSAGDSMADHLWCWRPRRQDAAVAPSCNSSLRSAMATLNNVCAVHSRFDRSAEGVFRVDHPRLALDAAVRGGNDRRHRAQQPGRTEAEPDRDGRGRHRGQHVTPRTTRPVWDPHVHPGSDCHTQKPDSNRPQPRPCATQPTPHRRRRNTQARADPAMPSSLGTGGQRGPNPLRRIRSAQKHRHRQQHVGDHARPAARPPRPQRIAEPLDLSGPSIPPAAQHTVPTRRAADPTGASRDSTRTGSASTVTIGASKHYSAAPRKPAKTSAGCRAPISTSSH